MFLVGTIFVYRLKNRFFKAAVDMNYSEKKRESSVLNFDVTVAFIGLSVICGVMFIVALLVSHSLHKTEMKAQAFEEWKEQMELKAVKQAETELKFQLNQKIKKIELE